MFSSGLTKAAAAAAAAADDDDDELQHVRGMSI